MKKRCGLDEEQIAWRRKQWKTLRQLAGQEYAEDPSSCFLASGECVFELEAIEKRRQELAGVVESEDNGRLTYGFLRKKGGATSLGWIQREGDRKGIMHARKSSSGTMVCSAPNCEGTFHRSNWQDELRNLGRVMGKRLLAVERNNHGYRRAGPFERNGIWRASIEKDGQLGWLTSAASRPAMIENMAAVLMAEPELFHSPRLLEECRTFIRRADGNAAAADGAHDDCVMAMAIALAVRREDAGRGVRKRAIEMASLVVESGAAGSSAADRVFICHIGRSVELE